MSIKNRKKYTEYDDDYFFFAHFYVIMCCFFMHKNKYNIKVKW